MSALDQALRQIEQQRQLRESAASSQGLVPEFFQPFEAAPSRTSYGMLASVVLLSLALVGTWLVMAGWWSVPLISQTDGRWMGKAQGLVVNPAGPGSSATSGSVPALPLWMTPTNEAAGATVSVTESGTPGLALPSKPFIYPAWHKSADGLWGRSQWEEASRVWLKGLNSQESPTQMLMIADQLSQLQVNRQYAAWSPLMPVVALPKFGVTKKRWMLLAVPAESDMSRAQQLLRLVQGQEAQGALWPHWQKALGLTGEDNASAATSAQNVPAAPSALSMTTPPVASSDVPKAAMLSRLPAAVRARDPLASKAGDLPQGGLAQTPPEEPQLSRTHAERLPASGPVPPTAKAIDVDYQMIEKSLARGEHQAALDAAIKLEKYIGENWRTQYLAGVALMGLNRWEAAIAALSKAQALNPRHATAALYLSVALQERGEHARAIQVLDKAQLQQPLSPELWLNQGHSHQALGHTLEARKAYNRFLELSVNRQDLAVQRVWVLNRLEKDKG